MVLTQRFEQHRPHLRAVAYRMLGSVGQSSDDALQEGWPRIRTRILAPSRTCGPGLRDSRRSGVSRHAAVARRREWRSLGACPGSGGEPREDDLEYETLLGRVLGLGLLVMLDALTPAERLAFVLHDAFGVPFADIATALYRSEAEAQQLASRGRRRFAQLAGAGP